LPQCTLDEISREIVDLTLWAKDRTNFNVYIAADLSPLTRCWRI